MSGNKTSDSDRNGFEVVAIDCGPDVIDDGDPCDRCRARRVAGEGSWIVEYAHGGLSEVCSACVNKLEVGCVDGQPAQRDPEDRIPKGANGPGTYQWYANKARKL